MAVPVVAAVANGAKKAAKVAAKIKYAGAYARQKINQYQEQKKSVEEQERAKRRRFFLMFGVPIIAVITILLFLLVVICVIYNYPRLVVESLFNYQDNAFQGASNAGGINSAYGATGMGSTSYDSSWESLYFKQCGEAWSDETFSASGGSVCSAGCGLIAITHVIDLLTGNAYTPSEINAMLKEYYNGNTSAYAPGGSIVGKLVEFATGKFELKSTHYDSGAEAVADMASGGNKVIICSDNGSGSNFIAADGSMYSGNHVIMAYRTDGNNVWVKDSGRGGNAVKYTVEQFSKINYVGFYVVSN